MQKARELAADAVIFDLEDAIAPASKAEARAAACAQVREGGYGKREVLIRINALGSDWGHDDLAAVAEVPLDGVVLPKVQRAAQAADCVQRLRALGSQAPVWAMIESPAGVLNVEAIAATPGVAVLVAGTNDLLKEMGALETPDRHALRYALSRLVLAARAHGLGVLDGVSPNFTDTEALLRLCQQGREIGFDGKTLIHPQQIAVANRAFGPTPEQVAQAQRRVAAWEAAGPDAGVIAVDGEMVEALHVAQAQAILAYQKAIDT